MIASTISVPARPPWLMPSMWRAALAAGRARFCFSPAERRVMHRGAEMAPSAWAEKYRVVTSGPMEGALWRHDASAYLAGIMDASFSSSVEEITVCAAPQVGKSAFVDTCLGYLADRAPGPALVVYPDKDTAGENSRDRIAKLFTSSPRLRRLLTPYTDDIAAHRIKLIHMIISMGWAGSATSLGNKSIRYLILDELDKYPATPAKKEAGTVDLAEKRTRAWRHVRKTWKISTPTVESGNIWQALIGSQCRFVYHARCPGCLQYQEMVFGDRESRHGIKWEGGGSADPEELIARGLARYICAHCGAGWDDHGRDQAVRAGRWVSVDDGLSLARTIEIRRPRSIGFHVPSWLSHFVSLAEPVAAFLRGRRDKIKLRDFQNSHAALPWQEHYGVERRPEEVLALRDSRPEGVAPAWAALVLLTADVQGDGIWYEARAWGVDGTSALLRYGFLPRFLVTDGERNGDFLALADVLGTSYRIEGGAGQIAARFCLVDSAYRTDEVYTWCRGRGIAAPCKGQPMQKLPLRYSKIDTLPGTGKLIPGGVTLVSVDADFFKDILAGALQINPADAGAWLLHSAATDEYGRHYTAELKDEETGTWQQIGNRANHLLDCGMMQQVAWRVMINQGVVAAIQAMATAAQPMPQRQPPEAKEAQRLW